MLLDVSVTPQPIGLRRKISPHNVGFVVLNAPGSDNNNIAYAEPYSSFHLAWDSSHTGLSILGPYSDSASAKHLFDRTKDLVLAFSRQSHLAWLFFNQRNTSIDVHVSRFLLVIKYT